MDHHSEFSGIYYFTAAIPQTGKSTLAYHFANSATFHDLSVLFIQCDPQGYFPHLKGLQPNGVPIRDPLNPELYSAALSTHSRGWESVVNSFKNRFKIIVVNGPVGHHFQDFSPLKNEGWCPLMTLLLHPDHLLKTDEKLGQLENLNPDFKAPFLLPNKCGPEGQEFFREIFQTPILPAIPYHPAFPDLLYRGGAAFNEDLYKLFENLLHQLKETSKIINRVKEPPTLPNQQKENPKGDQLEIFFRKNPLTANLPTQIIVEKNPASPLIEIQIKFQKKGSLRKKNYYDDYFSSLATGLFNYQLSPIDNLKEKQVQRLKRFHPGSLNPKSSPHGIGFVGPTRPTTMNPLAPKKITPAIQVGFATFLSPGKSDEKYPFQGKPFKGLLKASEFLPKNLKKKQKKGDKGQLHLPTFPLNTFLLLPRFPNFLGSPVYKIFPFTLENLSRPFANLPKRGNTSNWGTRLEKIKPQERKQFGFSSQIKLEQPFIFPIKSLPPQRTLSVNPLFTAYFFSAHLPFLKQWSSPLPFPSRTPEFLFSFISPLLKRFDSLLIPLGNLKNRVQTILLPSNPPLPKNPFPLFFKTFNLKTRARPFLPKPLKLKLLNPFHLSLAPLVSKDTKKTPQPILLNSIPSVFGNSRPELENRNTNPPAINLSISSINKIRDFIPFPFPPSPFKKLKPTESEIPPHLKIIYGTRNQIENFLISPTLIFQKKVDNYLILMKKMGVLFKTNQRLDRSTTLLKGPLAPSLLGKVTSHFEKQNPLIFSDKPARLLRENPRGQNSLTLINKLTRKPRGFNFSHSILTKTARNIYRDLPRIEFGLKPFSSKESYKKVLTGIFAKPKTQKFLKGRSPHYQNIFPIPQIIFTQIERVQKVNYLHYNASYFQFLANSKIRFREDLFPKIDLIEVIPLPLPGAFHFPPTFSPNQKQYPFGFEKEKLSLVLKSNKFHTPEPTPHLNREYFEEKLKISFSINQVAPLIQNQMEWDKNPFGQFTFSKKLEPRFKDKLLAIHPWDNPFPMTPFQDFFLVHKKTPFQHQNEFPLTYFNFHFKEFKIPPRELQKLMAQLAKNMARVKNVP